jgi:hypothetical protein
MGGDTVQHPVDMHEPGNILGVQGTVLTSHHPSAQALTGHLLQVCGVQYPPGLPAVRLRLLPPPSTTLTRCRGAQGLSAAWVSVYEAHQGLAAIPGPVDDVTFAVAADVRK